MRRTLDRCVSFVKFAFRKFGSILLGSGTKNVLVSAIKGELLIKRAIRLTGATNDNP